MSLIEAIHLQLRLEGFEIINGNRLRQVEVVPGEEMPLLILAQLANGQVAVYFDESIKHNLHLELMEQTQHIRFPLIDPLLRILGVHGIRGQVGHYKTNLFPATFSTSNSMNVECRAKNDAQVQKFGFGDFAEHVYVIERERKVVSACVSTRENERSGEAWVYTDPQYRHEGLARQVVTVWARDMLTAAKAPFYSYKIENTASAGLARHLGLVPVFEEIIISYADASVQS